MLKAMGGTNNLPAISAAAYAALQRGDFGAAKLLFDQVVTTGMADSAVWLGVAKVRRALGHASEAEQALDRALELDAYYFPALLEKGDAFDAKGDSRAASAYFSAAIKAAARYSALPDEWRAALRRAEIRTAQYQREFEAHLSSTLGRVGFDASAESRFAHAVDLLLGKRQVFSQQPKFFYYPELPQIEIFDKKLFPWTSELERDFDLIRDEASALLETSSDFVPYVQRETKRPTFNERGLLDNSDWSAFHLIKDGTTIEANAARCPHTFAAASRIPLSRIHQRTPSVLFSLLKAHARIPPHHGFTNARLIGHLPLIVPPNCGLRVGNETHRWREGEVVLFDDSIEHEAWNSSGSPRIVLIFDVWRPELSARERDLIAATLAAVNEFGGSARPWTD